MIGRQDLVLLEGKYNQANQANQAKLKLILLPRPTTSSS